MRSRWLIALLAVALLALAGWWRMSPTEDEALSAIAMLESPPAEGFARADSPRIFSFPEDFGPHSNFQTEWWYYTGNLETEDGRHFGYQLTFFRRALLPEDQLPQRQSQWAGQHIYMAHFALTDTQAGQHYASERFSRGEPGLAGAQSQPFEVWLEDWRIEQTDSRQFTLFAQAENAKIQLTLEDHKAPILHGDAGLSQKGPEAGNASYYFSQTRLSSQGSISVDGESYAVKGLSWMDHEFSTSALSTGQIGWDWFSIQLDDGRELMLFQLRRSDGLPDPYSSATLIEVDGSTQHFTAEDFTLTELDHWQSPRSEARYPIGWRIEIAALDLHLETHALLPDQELELSFTYWEGAAEIRGNQGSQMLSGMGYIEMTGYALSMEGQF